MATGTIYFLYLGQNDGDGNELSTGRIISAEVAENTAEIQFISEGYTYIVNMERVDNTESGFEGYWQCGLGTGRFCGRFHPEPSGYSFIGEHIEEGNKFKILCEIIA